MRPTLAACQVAKLICAQSSCGNGSYRRNTRRSRRGKGPDVRLLAYCYRRNRMSGGLTLPLCKLVNTGATFVAQRPYERNLCGTSGATSMT